MKLAATLLAGSLAVASGAGADPQTIAPGATLSPGQIGHVFAHVCFASSPLGVLRGVKQAAEEMALEPAEADAVVAMRDRAQTLLLTVDGGLLDATCSMVVEHDTAGDGFALYESVEAHLLERRHEETEAEAVDGGLVWTWKDAGTRFSLTFTESAEAFTLTLAAER